MKPSRSMITGELSWAWIAFAFAWSGSGFWPFGDSYLYRVLGRQDLDELWSIAVGVPALLLMFFSLREYAAHRWPPADPYKRWSIVQLDQSARIRGRMCLALLFSWAYVVYVLTNTQARPSALILIALGGVLFMGWFWTENRRVQRDIRKQTTSFRAPVQG